MNDDFTPYVVPAPHDTLTVPVSEGATIAVRQHGAERGNRILLSHGNGLAADLYYPYWTLFLDRFEVFIFDLRNHGWNPVGDLRHHNPLVFARDLEDAILPAIDREFGRKPTLGVFHSISALASLLPPSRGAWFAGLLLFDPPICGSGLSHREFDAHAEIAQSTARLRRERFGSHAELISLLDVATTFATMTPPVKRLYAETLLRPRPDGSGYELRCPAEAEAQTVAFLSAYSTLVDYDNMVCPIKVIGADPTLPCTYLPSFDPRLVTKVDYDFIPDVGHNVPLEAPERAHELTLEFMEGLGLTVPSPPTG